MKTINQIFNCIYTKEQLIKDVYMLRAELSEEYSNFFGELPYTLSSSLDNLLISVCEKLSQKVFSLGFCTATKLTAESFVKVENDLEKNKL